MDTVKAVIFDAEDVIYSRNEDSFQPLVHFFKLIDQPRSYKEIRQAYEQKKVEMYKGVISKHDHFKRMLKRLNVSLSDSQFQDFQEAFVESHDNIHINPAIEPTFKTLQEKEIRIIVLSDTFASAEKKKEWFEKIGLGSYIEKTFCSSEINHTKDEKEAYEKVLQDLNVKEEEVAFVGHQAYEMLGAKSANIKAISIVKDIGEDIFVDNLQQLPEQLTR